jgi:hypothetical protein
LRSVDQYVTVYQNVLPTDEMRVNAVSNCFPPKSRAARWFTTHRSKLSTPRLFREAFIEYFGGTASDERDCRNRLLNFRQRDSNSVTEYYSALCELVDDIHALVDFLHAGDPAQQIGDSLLISKFVNGLSSSVYDGVERVHIRNPDFTLEDLYREALLEEKLSKCKHNGRPTPPALHAIDETPKRCFFCKGNHQPKDCPKIAAKKAKGIWKEMPRKNQ